MRVNLSDNSKNDDEKPYTYGERQKPKKFFLSDLKKNAEFSEFLDKYRRKEEYIDLTDAQWDEFVTKRKDELGRGFEKSTKLIIS